MSEGNNTSTETDTDASEKEASSKSVPCPTSMSSDIGPQPELIRLQSSPISSPELSTSSDKKKKTKFIKTLRLSTDQVVGTSLLFHTSSLMNIFLFFKYIDWKKIMSLIPTLLVWSGYLKMLGFDLWFWKSLFNPVVRSYAL